MTGDKKKATLQQFLQHQSHTATVFFITNIKKQTNKNQQQQQFQTQQMQTEASQQRRNTNGNEG